MRPSPVWVNALKQSGYGLLIVGTAFSISLCGIGLGVYLGALLLQWACVNDEKKIPLPHWRFILLLLASLTVSLCASAYTKESFHGLGKYIQGFAILYAGMDLLRDRGSVKRFSNLLIVVFMAVCVDALFQYFSGKDLLFGHPGIQYTPELFRIRGPYHHSNDFGTLILMSIGVILPSCLILWRRKQIGLFGLMALCLIISVFVLYQTLSRSAYLGYLVALVFFCLALNPSKRTVLWILVMVAVVLLIPTEMNERLKTVFDLSKSGNSAERLLLAQTALRMIAHSPIFGLGLNTYAKYFTQFRPPDYPGIMAAHNTFLQMGTEAGLVGLALYLMIIFVFLRDFLRNAPGLDYAGRVMLIGITCALVGFLINCLFESALQSTQLRSIFWLYMGIAGALAYSARNAEVKS